MAGLFENVHGSDEVRGIDIGTGASAIYPLLLCSTTKGFMIALEMDKRNFEFALENVARNALSERINVIKVDGHSLLPRDIIKDEKFDFVMVNPPFYHSQAQIENSKYIKGSPSHSFCQASNAEMITYGGEIVFLSQLVKESQDYKNQIKWFTCLIGFKKDVEPLKIVVQSLAIKSLITTSFKQGKTVRWYMAWSWLN